MSAAALSVVQWQSPQMLGVALLVGVLVVLAVVLLYPSQVRSLPAAWRVSLPGLRCAALLALAASLARPVAQRALSEGEQGAVVVLVDGSKSMAQRDGQRTPAMLVALADGLGRLPAGVRARAEVFAAIVPLIDRLPVLVATIVQAEEEIDFALLQGKENPAAQARLDEAAGEFAKVSRSLLDARERLKPRASRLADALGRLERVQDVKRGDWAARVGREISAIGNNAQQFMAESDEQLYRTNVQVRAVCDELAKMTRLELVEQALAHPDAGLLNRLPAKAPLYGYAVGSAGAAPLPLRGPGGAPVRRLMMTPDGAKSDLTGGVREVLDQLRHQRVQAVVLFSDGRQVGAEEAIASGLTGGGAPVYAVSPAPPAKDAPVRDVSVEDVTLPFPPNVFVGESLNVTARVRWSGVKAPTEAVLQVGGRQQRRRIEARGDAGTVSFSLQMTEPGPQRLTVSVPAAAGEINAENNTAARWVKVLSDKFDVLLVGGSPSWDFRYLRNALARTEWVSARSVLLDSDNSRLGLTADQLVEQDVVILCDAPARSMSNGQWEAVRKMVAQRGGSVVLIAGQAHLPREYVGDWLAEFLPYKRGAGRGAGGAVWRMWPGEEPEFRVVPAPDAPPVDVPSLDDEAERSLERWAGLPPVFRFLELPPLKEAVRTLLVERSTGAPVLTRQRLGRGKVFFLGVDETWRWRYKVGERDQDRFFRQLVRSAADDPYAASNAYASLDADRVMVAPGEAVRVRAKLVEPAEGGESDGLDLEIVKDDELLRVQRLGVVGGADSGRYEGQVTGLAAGEYRLRVRGPDGSELEYPIHVAESYEAELADLNAGEDLLGRMAAASGGEVQTLEQLGELSRRLSEAREQGPRTTELRLWSSWYLYAFVVACLGAEWALRKRFGLS